MALALKRPGLRGRAYRAKRQSDTLRVRNSSRPAKEIRGFCRAARHAVDNQPKVMSQPIVLTNGQHEIKIYTVQNRGRSVYQPSFYEGGHRQRKTFANGQSPAARPNSFLGVLHHLCFHCLKVSTRPAIWEFAGFRFFHEKNHSSFCLNLAFQPPYCGRRNPEKSGWHLGSGVQTHRRR